MIATQEPFAPKARRNFFFKDGAEESVLGARAAVYRGAAVLFGAEDGAARNGTLHAIAT